jgi:hypothetical protein
MNDGVWYTVVGNGSDIIIDVTAVTGWDPELGVYTGSCGNFTCVASIDDGGTSAGETYTIVASTLGTTYYINVGHYSGFADSPEGPFTIDVTTTLSSGSFNNANFSAYPNPVKEDGKTNIKFTSKTAGNYEVKLLNALGQVVKTQSIKHMGIDANYVFSFPIHMSHGHYTLEINGKDGQKTRLKILF